ncbi:MAG: glycosyl hydrolase family 65 protein [Balneolales bacterium]
MPDDLSYINYPIYYRGHWIRLHLTKSELHLTCDGGWSTEPLFVVVKNQQYTLQPNEEKVFKYGRKMVKAG